jgi:hypothetical protein
VIKIGLDHIKLGRTYGHRAAEVVTNDRIGWSRRDRHLGRTLGQSFGGQGLCRARPLPVGGRWTTATWRLVDLDCAIAYRNTRQVWRIAITPIAAENDEVGDVPIRQCARRDASMACEPLGPGCVGNKTGRDCGSSRTKSPRPCLARRHEKQLSAKRHAGRLPVR